MIGAGTLLRVLGKNGGRLLGRLGVLPPRWYLRDALEALAKDDLPGVIQALRRAHRGHSRRWELIRQQAVFRCRVLKENHEQAVRRMEHLRQAGGLEKTSENDLEQAKQLHRLAIRILSTHEADLQSLLT